MVGNIILGVTIDTKLWISKLEALGEENIIVINYDSKNDFEKIGETLCMTPDYAKKYIKKFDKKNFYKSLYVFPTQ